MFQKIFNYLNKIFFQYIVIIITTFLLTILFFKNNEPIFLNLYPPNNIKEINKLIDQYLQNHSNSVKKRKITKKLLNKGSFLLNPLFKRIKSDSAHKTEYITILKQLDIIQSCSEYDLDCYTEKWSKIRYKYTKQHINSLLKSWILNKSKRLKIEEELRSIGKYSLPSILKFLIAFDYLNYESTKPLYTLLNKIKDEPIFEEKLFTQEELIKEFFRYFHTKYSYYYQDFTLTNRIKTVFLDTQFSNYFISAFSFNFGTIHKNSVYSIISNFFFRTLLISLFLIIFSYYFTILIILRIKRKSNLLYKFLDKTFHILSLIPSLMLLVFLVLSSRIFNLSGKEELIEFLLLSFLIIILIIFRNIESIVIREKNKDEILSLKFYGLKESIIFKKYVYQNINLNLLKKIKLLIILIISHIIIIEYLIGFNGLGKIFMDSLIKENYNILRISILLIGITILIIQVFVDFIIFINLKEINKDETNN